MTRGHGAWYGGRPRLLLYTMMPWERLGSAGMLQQHQIEDGGRADASWRSVQDFSGQIRRLGQRCHVVGASW